jgi:hypothetical protein
MTDSIKVNDFMELMSSFVDGRVLAALQKTGQTPASKQQETPAETGLIRKRDQAVQKITRLWKNNGVDPDTGIFVKFDQMMASVGENEQKLASDWRTVRANSSLSAEDMAASPDIMLIMPKVVSQIIMEPIPYTETIAPLLRTVNMKGGSVNIVYPAIGAMGGQKLDMAEGGEYPEATLDMAGVMNVKIGKSGIAVSWTEEMRRYSQFEFMAYLLRQASRCLVRWKDKKCADHVLALGRTTFDNDDVAAAHTTGRKSDGSYNNTFSIQDLFTMYAEMINKGFTPDTLILHPMAWLIFARDPILRSIAMLRGGGPFFKTNQGQVPYAGKFEINGMALGPTLALGGQAAIAGMYTSIFDNFPVPLRVVISPAVPFRYDSGVPKTSIILCDSNELGVIFVDEEPTSDRWDDPSRDVFKVKIRERYAIGILNGGEAVRTAKNVVIARNFDFDDRLYWVSGTGVLPTGTI